MALITRFSRLFSADLHAVLDRVEEPAIVLKQAIRDMQSAVAAAEARLRALQARARQIDGARSASAARLKDTAEELDVCLEASDDDLARSVIQRKLELERQMAAFDREAERIAGTLDDQQRAVAARRRELEGLRSQAEAFDSAAHEDPGMSAPAAGVSSQEVEVALLREKQRRARS